jgi:hypothetical protein
MKPIIERASRTGARSVEKTLALSENSFSKQDAGSVD